jgi:hypothetical protein
VSDEIYVPPFFPRGPGPLISVIFPSRGRPTALERAVRSCLEKAQDPRRLEFCLKADDDDAATQERALQLQAGGLPVQVLVSPRGAGYWDMHLWLDALAKLAKGDWLFVFNDDAEMVEQGWDQKLYDGVPLHGYPGVQDVCLIVPWGDPGFFFLRRRTYELLGHVSGDPCADTWIAAVMELAGCVPNIGIKLKHHHLQDEVREQAKWIHFALDRRKSREGRLRDAALLTAYLGGLEDVAVWTKEPVRPGWHICRWPGASVPAYVAPDKRIASQVELDMGKAQWTFLHEGVQPGVPEPAGVSCDRLQ